MSDIDAELPRSDRVDPEFRRDVLAGLSRSARSIPPRWFYDRRGSELFEQITALPEYYPTRTETALLAAHAKEIAEHTGRGPVVVEFGSGSSTKTPILLSAIAPAAYVAIDISGDFLRGSCGKLARAFPGLAIYPLEGDFTKPLRLPDASKRLRKLGFFPGSTIGNMTTSESVRLLREMARTLDGGMLLIGIDRRKHPSILTRAYDDSSGITAAFNLNLLHRINRELKASIPVDEFRHEARWNESESRIEMHLQAKRDLSFEIDGSILRMKAGETIHTENSYKYTPEEARHLLRSADWTPVADWTDEHGMFGIYLAAFTRDA